MQALNPDAEAAEAGEGPVESPEVDIVCFFASASESGGTLDRLTQPGSTNCHGFTERIGALGDKVVGIVEVGGTHEELARVVRDVVALRKPRWVIGSGFAVGLAKSVREGEIVVAERIIDAADYSLNTGTTMPEAKGLRVGTLLTLDKLPMSHDMKQELAVKDALACETQAAIVAEVCRILKTPMMGIHCIAESANSSRNQLVKKVKSQESLAGMIGAAAGALLDHPGSVKEFWNDKESSLRLSDRLATFLTGVMAQLPTEK